MQVWQIKLVLLTEKDESLWNRLTTEDLYIDKSVAAAKVKLERSIATNKILHVGDIITEDDLHMLSPGDGYKWAQKDEVIGKTVTVEIPKDEVIYPNMIK